MKVPKCVLPGSESGGEQAGVHVLVFWALENAYGGVQNAYSQANLGSEKGGGGQREYKF